MGNAPPLCDSSGKGGSVVERAHGKSFHQNAAHTPTVSVDVLKPLKVFFTVRRKRVESKGGRSFQVQFQSMNRGACTSVLCRRNRMNGTIIQAMTRQRKEFSMALTDTAVRQANATGTPLNLDELSLALSPRR
jgi:hypothetical protein